MLDGISKEGIFKALVAVVGAFAFGFIQGMLPTFAYSGLIYGFIGVLVVVFGFHLIGKGGSSGYLGAFLVGLGIAMGSGLIGAVKSLLAPATSNAAAA